MAKLLLFKTTFFLVMLTLLKLTLNNFFKVDIIEESIADTITIDVSVLDKPKKRAPIKKQKVAKKKVIKEIISKKVVRATKVIYKKVTTLTHQAINNKRRFTVLPIKVIEPKITSWVRRLDDFKLEEKLLAIRRTPKNPIKEIRKEKKSEPVNINNFDKELLALKKKGDKILKIQAGPNNHENQEMVFFDYSPDDEVPDLEKKIPKLLSENLFASDPLDTSPDTIKIKADILNDISTNVNSAIARLENQISKNIKIDRKKSRGFVIAKADKVNTHAAAPSRKVDYSKAIESMVSQFVSEESKNALLKVNAVSVEINNSIQGPANNFELINNHNPYADRYDALEGAVTIEKEIKSSTSTMNSTIRLQGHFPTEIDLNFENNLDGGVEITVPLISYSSLVQFLSEKNLQGIGGHILIDLHNETKEIELGEDNEEEAIIYLDDNFKEVNNRKKAKFILFVGVPAGNTLISYKTYNDKLLHKVIYLEEDSIYFDINDYASIKSYTFNLLSESTMSKGESTLDISSQEIKKFISNESAIKRGLNRYELEYGKKLFGQRNYMELTHLPDAIFVGTGMDVKDVIVPDTDYIVNVFNIFNISDLAGRCLVQFNLNSSVDEVSVFGRAPKNGMNIDVKYLNDLGELTDVATQKTNRIFVMGDQQGIINLDIKYLDDSAEGIQTFCSEHTYIIEQL